MILKHKNDFKTNINCVSILNVNYESFFSQILSILNVNYESFFSQILSIKI